MILSYAVFLWLAGCGDIPYRSAGYSVDPNCREIYDKYHDISELNKDIPENIRSNQCACAGPQAATRQPTVRSQDKSSTKPVARTDVAASLASSFSTDTF